MNTSEATIIFSIGPVQSFIAQARKTQDLWVGSYLLSYLTGVALCEFMDSGGTIESPNLDENNFFSFIKSLKEKSDRNKSKGLVDAPKVGSIPNQAVIKAKNKDPFQLAKKAELTVRKEWLRICNTIWDRYFSRLEKQYPEVKNIWEKQITNFWNIRWLIVEREEDIKYFSNFKLWSPFSFPVEKGDRCKMMGNWQEISGFIRGKSASDKDNQDSFWEQVRDSIPKKHELKDDERLSSIALIKRLFPLCSDEILNDKAMLSWPSTVYIAALPWLFKLEEKAATDLELRESLINFAKDVNILSYLKRPDVTQWFDFNFNKEGASEDAKAIKPFFQLDAQLYYADLLKNENKIIFPSEYEELRETLSKNLVDNIYKCGIKPSPYYSVLIMDGDKIGDVIKKLKEKGEKEAIKKVSKILAKFAIEVEEIVRNYNGVLVYAGGDDVLAFVPINKVISCAISINNKFVEEMDKHAKKTTMSAGIVFAHFNDPLQDVLKKAHYLLDEVAKDYNGRSSIAISLLKGGTKEYQYVTTFDVISSIEKNGYDFEKFISELFYDSSVDLSIGALYRIRNIFRKLNENKKISNSLNIVKISDFGKDLSTVLKSEFVTHENRKLNNEKLDSTIYLLIELMKRSYRVLDENNEYIPESSENEFFISFLDIIKFLYQHGVGNKNG